MNTASGYRAMRAPDIVASRRGMLRLSHVAPLTDFVMRLRDMHRGEVPDFDPLDGGTNACVLFLFEKPGPMTSLDRNGRISGSGFISRDNDDPTAEATFRFMESARLDREITVTWNIIPWWNGTRKITREESQAGLIALLDLLDLLPNLSVAVLVGRKAGRARRHLEERGLTTIESAHPSPIVRASRPAMWNAIPGRWSEAKGLFQARVGAS